jgi:hypothetical protein
MYANDPQYKAMCKVIDAVLYFGNRTPNNADQAEYWQNEGAQGAAICGWPIIIKTETKRNRRGERIIQHLRFRGGEMRIETTHANVAKRVEEWLNLNYDLQYTGEESV